MLRLDFLFAGLLTFVALALFGCADETKPSADLTENQLSRARARLTVSTGGQGQECGALVTADWKDLAKSQCKEYSDVPTHRDWCETHINIFLAKYPKVDCFIYTIGPEEPRFKMHLKADELIDAQFEMAGYRICGRGGFCPSHIYREYRMLPEYCNDHTDVLLLTNEQMEVCHDRLKTLITTAMDYYRQAPDRLGSCVVPSFSEGTCKRVSFIPLNGLLKSLRHWVPQEE